MKQQRYRFWTFCLTLGLLFVAMPILAQGGHRLTVVAKPAMAGTFNKSEAELVAGQTISLVAYANSNFDFVRWTDQSGQVVSQQMNFTYTMPAHDVQLTAEYEYNPANPQNPATNYWNKELGEVIIDDFTTGRLQAAVTTAISGSSHDDVTMITVAGVMNSNDFGIINTYTACTLLDLSRVTGVTQVPSYAFDYTNLESVYLPATIESIGSQAFAGCQQLSSLIIYAMMPPTLGSNVFRNVSEGLVVYVPAAAISQYQDATGWKDFTILPIQEDIRSISVSLPSGTNAADYAQMWLELTNTKSGQRMYYVMTDRTLYTFANIIRNTTWNVTLRNERGDIFGQIDNVEVKDEDVSVVFSALSKPQTVTLQTVVGDSSERRNDVTITWTDAQGNYLAQGTTLTGLCAGTVLNYRIQLSQELAMQYLAPEQTAYTVTENGNDITVSLKPIGELTLTGTVKDLATGLPLSGATVSASQTFSGKYTKTVNAKTDSKGAYTLAVAAVPTQMAFAATDYVSQTRDISDHELLELHELEDVSLKAITGATISIGFTYTTVEGETQSWYSDYQNVSYELFNVTKNRAVGQYSVQYPQIVLLEEVDDGDVLRLTATSRTTNYTNSTNVGAFMPVEATATIAGQKAEATFAIVELGRIHALFTTTGNATVVGSLYDAAGKLVKTYDYTNATLTISDLADGQYTLVTMGSSRLFNTIYDLAQLPQTGLTEGTDYVANTVAVKSGAVASISISEVPTLDESKLYYTGDNTSFTVNKPSIVAGNYLTLTGRIDFKPAYATSVSNVQMIVDLPEACEFVENSVMVGNSTSSYTLNGNQVVIPMARYTDRVRFCIIPTLGGDYAPSAFVQFDLDGETVTQPIGSANYTAKDLSISVPSTVAKTAIPVSGTAIGTSNVEIYDNNVLIGKTTSMANGTWATTCELNEPYNLSRHQIYAKVTTKQGLELQSESVECLYDMNAIQVSKVMMYHDNPEMHRTYEIIFDFLNPKEEDQYYIYYIYNKKFTFTIDFTSNDTTKISNVVLNVITGNGETVSIPASFDQKQKVWVAAGEFGNMYDGNIPINVSVDYSCEVNNIVDRAYIEEQKNISFEDYQENLENRKVALEESSLVAPDNTIFDILNGILDADSLDIDKLSDTYKIFKDEGIVVTDSLDDASIDRMILELTEDYNQWKVDYSNELDSLIEDFYFNEELSSEMSAQSVQYDGIINYEMSRIDNSEIQLLLNEGYSSYQLTDSSYIYYKYNENGYDYIDVQNKIRYRVYKDALNNSRNSSIRKSETGNKSVNECAKSIGTTIQNIKRLHDTGKLSVKDAISQFSSLAGFFQCYYSAIILNADVSLTSGYNKAIEDYNIKIGKRESLKEISLNRIDNFTEKLASSSSDKKYVDDLLAAGQKQLQNSNLSPEEFKSLSQKCSEWKQQSLYYEAEIKSYKAALKKENSTLAALVNQLDDLKKGKSAIEKAKDNINKILAKIPKKIAPTGKLGKIIGVGGKLAGFFGEVINVWSVGCDVLDALNELKEWGDLEDAIDRKMPCENDAERALALQQNIHSEAASVLAEYIIILSAEVGGIASNLAGGVSGVSVSWWLGSLANIYAEWAKVLRIGKYIEKRGDYWLDIMYLKCTGKEPDDPRKNKDKDKKRRHEDSGNKNSGKGIDPSGYVYEGVFSNRVEGATATAYYKEMVEDMYGDLHENIVKWDAEEYAQENPLFTDENGYYRWDVPQGLWQVKFEKEGYETTYSEWLPVPPPQLDVNIPMKQNVQPTVKMARAYEDAVEVEFDKYMMPELLTAENVSVLQNGIAVEGTVELLNEEPAGWRADTGSFGEALEPSTPTLAEEGETFASKIRFNTTKPFDAEEVTLIVSNRVRSYADIRMQDDYLQTFAVEQEIKQILSDSLTAVRYGNTKQLVVEVLPASASKGKRLNVKSSSPSILTVDNEQVVIDNDGLAEVVLTGELPGTAALTFTVEGSDKTATTIASVQPLTMFVATPINDLASGEFVEYGTTLTLACVTEGATIYYTLDGSCPCDEQRRIEYTGPIALPVGMVTVKAIAVKDGMEDSDIATFIYHVDGSTVGAKANEKTNDITLFYSGGTVAIIGAAGGECRVYDAKGVELAHHTKLGRSERISVPRQTVYVVRVTTGDTTVVRKLTARRD